MTAGRPPAGCRKQLGERLDVARKRGVVRVDARLLGIQLCVYGDQRGEREGRRRERVGEDFALSRECVEIRRQIELAPVGAESIDAQGVDGEKEHESRVVRAVVATGRGQHLRD